MVQIHVGSEPAETFTVHKDLICYHPKYFKAAFEGSFEEAEKSEIPLPDTKPSVFRAYMQWLYRQASGAPNSEPSACIGRDDEIQAVELFIFANRYDTRRLRIKIVEFFMHHLSNRTAPQLSFSAVALPRNSLPHNSTLG